MNFKTSKICASAHISDNSAQNNFVSSVKQGIFCAHTGFQRKPSLNFRGLKPIFALRATLALLAAMLLLVSCAPPESLLKPNTESKPKTEGEKSLSNVERYQIELNRMLQKETAAKIKYEEAKGQPNEMQIKAELDAATAAVEQARKRLAAAIEALAKVAGGAEVAKVKKSLRDFMDALADMRNTTSVEIAKQKKEAIAALKNESDKTLADMRNATSAEIAKQKKAAIASLKNESDKTLADMRNATSAEIAKQKKEAIASLKNESDKTLADMRNATSAEIAKQKKAAIAALSNEYDKALAKLKKDLASIKNGGGNGVSKKKRENLNIDDAVVVYKKYPSYYSPWYKVANGGSSTFLPGSPPESEGVHNHIFSIFSHSWLKDYVITAYGPENGSYKDVVNVSQNASLVRKSDSAAFPLGKLRMNLSLYNNATKIFPKIGDYIYYKVYSRRKSEIRRFRPGPNPLPETIATIYGRNNVNYLRFIADTAGNVLTSGIYNKVALHLANNGGTITPALGGNALPYDAIFTVVDGKLSFLTQERNSGKYDVQLYSFGTKAQRIQNDEHKKQVANGKVGGLFLPITKTGAVLQVAYQIPYNSYSDRIYNLEKQVLILNLSGKKLYQLSGGASPGIKAIGMPSGKEVAQIDSNNTLLVESSQTALYGVFGPNKNRGTEIFIWRPASSSFQPFFNGGSNYADIYQLSVFSGSPTGDKLAIAAEDNAGKSWIILLDANGSVERKIEAGGEVYNLQRIR